MISSAELLTNFEHCNRWGFWAQSWFKHRMPPMQALHAAIRAALVEDVPDPGEAASDHLMLFAADRGLELDNSINIYRCARNHAALADIVTTAIRRSGKGEAWIEDLITAKPLVDGWTTSAMVDPTGLYLRRFIAVSSWSAEREFYEKASWYCLGEIAFWQMPMQLVVAVVGPMSGGRRHAPWSKGLFHHNGSQLRFQLHRRSRVEGFAESWAPIYREDHDEIDREKWLASMMQDEVLQTSLFVVDIPVPEQTELEKIRLLARQKLVHLNYPGPLPDKQLSTCHNPLHPCAFRACCWHSPERTPEESGLYDRHDKISVP